MKYRSNDNYVCCRCNVALEMKKVEFTYLGVDFSHDMPKCPKCGAVFVPEEIAENKMAEVEKMLEGK